MDHSIAAKYAARPAAHFVRPSARARERRLGLNPSGLRVEAGRATLLRHPELPPLVSLRGRWRSITPATETRAVSGPPRPRVAMTWSRSGRTGIVRRSSAVTAPWRV